MSMPNFYVPPLGGPLYWGDEQSGVLQAAVQAFFAWSVKEGPPLLRAQWKLVLDYCRYYIDAPCWDANPHHDEQTRAGLQVLRKAIRAITPENAEMTFDSWLRLCLDAGIDPL